MDAFNYDLRVFESFQRYQDQLDANHLLKLKTMEPQTTYYVEAKLGDSLEWTEYAYTERERDLLVKDAKDCGFTYTVEEVQQ